MGLRDPSWNRRAFMFSMPAIAAITRLNEHPMDKAARALDRLIAVLSRVKVK
jgi:hypothetical protein